MSITYTDTLAGLTEAQLTGFCSSWAQAPSPGVLLRLLAGSAASVLAVEEGTGRVVGFLGVVTDPQGQAYVPMLEVLPAYRESGIVSELRRRMMTKLAPRVACYPVLTKYARVS